MSPSVPVEHEIRELEDLVVLQNLIKIRWCVVCNNEMTDEICCTCEIPTVPKTHL